jgi:hypothetical protein
MRKPSKAIVTTNNIAIHAARLQPQQPPAPALFLFLSFRSLIMLRWNGQRTRRNFVPALCRLPLQARLEQHPGVSRRSEAKRLGCPLVLKRRRGGQAAGHAIPADCFAQANYFGEIAVQEGLAASTHLPATFS